MLAARGEGAVVVMAAVETAIERTDDFEVVVTDEQRAALLELVRDKPGIGIAKALRDVGVAGTKGQLRAFVAADQEFSDAIQEARAVKLRDELMTRAVDGVEEPIVNKDGDIVGYKTVRSDRLLEFACRMYLPEARVLRDGRTHVEVTGADGAPLQVGAGVSLGEVAAVLLAARAMPAELEAGAEIIAEQEDEPAGG